MLLVGACRQNLALSLIFKPMIPWTWYRSGTKMAEKWGLASAGKSEKRPGNGKNGPRKDFRAIFPFSGPFSPISQVRPKSIFRPFSSPELQHQGAERVQLRLLILSLRNTPLPLCRWAIRKHLFCCLPPESQGLPFTEA